MKKVLCLILMATLLLGALPGMADTVVGMLEDAAMNSLSVHTDDGECVDIAMGDDTQVVGEDGLLLGERVVVEYADSDPDDAELALASKVTILDSLIGTVKSASENDVTIEAEDDNTKYTFAETDITQIVGKKGIVVGKKAEIAYEGALDKDADVQSAKVWEIYAENSLYGEIEKIEDEELHLKTKHATYVFDIANAYIAHEKYTEKGNEATLYFFGNLDDEADVQQVRVHSVYAKEPEPKMHTLTGVIKDISMHQITVHTKKGNTYTFAITDSTKKSDVENGDTVKCYYTGKLDGKRSTESAKLHKFSLIEKHRTEPKYKKVKGEIIDASMHVIVIKTAKHNTYIFSLPDDFKNDLAEGIVLGEKVEIDYTGHLKKSKHPQKVKLLRIADA